MTCLNTPASHGLTRTGLTLASLLFAACAWGQSGPAAPATSHTGAPFTLADVRKVDVDANKITLKHGPIIPLDMPAMTMVFQVRNPALLLGIQAGDRVSFTAEQLQGAYVVTGLQKVAP
jgi:Cu/Ag efflux protein CusF